MKKTTGDIYLNIEDSDYITIIDRVDRIELYFTSMFYKMRGLSKLRMRGI